MSNDHPPQHSGSRWEPSPGGDPSSSPAGSAPVLGADVAAGTAADVAGGSSDDRKSRRRGPLLAVLAAVLTLGASTAGIAYVQAAQEPRPHDPAAAGDAPSALGDGRADRAEQAGPQGPGAADDGDGGADGAGHRGRHHDHDDAGHDDSGQSS